MAAPEGNAGIVVGAVIGSNLFNLPVALTCRSSSGRWGSRRGC